MVEEEYFWGKNTVINLIDHLLLLSVSFNLFLTAFLFLTFVENGRPNRHFYHST